MFVRRKLERGRYEQSRDGKKEESPGGRFPLDSRNGWTRGKQKGDLK